jgi:virginiamycin A acetyltransferase
MQPRSDGDGGRPVPGFRRFLSWTFVAGKVRQHGVPGCLRLVLARLYAHVGSFAYKCGERRERAVWESEQALEGPGRKSPGSVDPAVGEMHFRLILPNEQNEQAKPIVRDMDQKPGFVIGSVGKYSYASFEVYVNYADYGKVTNLQIGNHSSLAFDISLLFNRDHDYKSLTMSSSSLFSGREPVYTQKGQILIGHDVWIGGSVYVLSGVRIGNGAIIGARSVVSKDIPPYAIAVGNPIRVVKYRYNEDQIRKLLQIRWWDWKDEVIASRKHYFSGPVSEFLDAFYQEPSQEFHVQNPFRSTVILFYPDFEDPYPIWKKIICEFIERWESTDDITLALKIGGDGLRGESVAELIGFAERALDEKKLRAPEASKPDIVIADDKFDWKESDFFDVADYYVAGRGMHTMQHIQYCDDHGTTILSGVDIPALKQVVVKNAASKSV